ncbi:flagellar motor protein [Alicyclobacillus dauci]|uniref:Flagellar motor protein n=1 Tax=Alicyclobacillus dauci TaxID=1475485 RepID=A0ABY6Z268_9BACL|nr:flagellar motor protein [Alicyclobacillus dauci]WAH36603.1 flagellar motor protein [Alicyclobacillus dauci]
MDFATIIGLIVAVVGLAFGFTLDGGSLASLWRLPALVIVFGGTIGATLLGSRMKSFTGIGKYLKIAFFTKATNPHDTIESLVNLAIQARREGILALEENVEQLDDQFLKNGVRLVVDGVDPELAKQMLETEISYIERRHEAGIGMFESAGGFAPTMGIIGTVMGLIHVLGNLDNVSKLGPEIATAFTATLYGVASANILWLPLANKLKARSEDEVLEREMTLEGILSIQAGENPNVLKQKLLSFLASSQRERKGRAGEADAETAEA